MITFMKEVGALCAHLFGMLIVAILYFKRKKLKNQQNVMQFKLLPEDISQDIRADNLGEFSLNEAIGFDPKSFYLLEPPGY